MPTRDSRLFRLLRLRHPARFACACAVASCLAGVLTAGLLYSGWYNVSALTPHWSAVFKLLELGMRQSVRHHARDIAVPPRDAAMALAGEGIYRQHCVVCHGAPGVAPGVAGLSMQPVPGPLAEASRKWKPRELYWIIRNGIKMTGMPAWQSHLDNEQTWALVAYLEVLPQRDPAAGGDALAPPSALPDDAAVLASGDAGRGRVALTQYACQSCHRIPGIVGAETFVGPALEGLRERHFIAGILPNTPANLAYWIRYPRHLKPGSAMPELNLPAQEAADMVAYLRQMETH